MNTRKVTPKPGGTYIMTTSEPKTIVFEFVNVGHYRVNGVDKKAHSHSDLGSPYAITDGPFDHKLQARGNGADPAIKTQEEVVAATRAMQGAIQLIEEEFPEDDKDAIKTFVKQRFAAAYNSPHEHFIPGEVVNRYRTNRK